MNRTVLLLALAPLLISPATSSARDKLAKLSVVESVEIVAPKEKVWAIVRDWDGLHRWHPAFSSVTLKKGKNNTPMAVRIVTLNDGGATIEETLDEFDGKRMYYNYRIVGDSPLPVSHYAANISVKAGETKGTSVLTWQGSFRRKTIDNPPLGEDDEGAKKFISAAYRAGLDNVKKLAEMK
jgi:mxaD protein